MLMLLDEKYDAHLAQAENLTTLFVSMHDEVCIIIMLNKNTWGVKKCGVNQKQHCKQAGVTKRFDIS